MSTCREYIMSEFRIHSLQRMSWEFSVATTKSKSSNHAITKYKSSNIKILTSIIHHLRCSIFKYHRVDGFFLSLISPPLLSTMLGNSQAHSQCIQRISQLMNRIAQANFSVSQHVSKEKLSNEISCSECHKF